MKPQHFFYGLAIIAVLFTACKKDKDYRDKWVGIYKFTTIDHIDHYNPSGPIFHTDSIRDTISFMGSVNIYKNNRLKIIFKPNTKEPDLPFDGGLFPAQVFGLIYPIVDNSGKLNYPELLLSHGGFEGFCSTNGINIGYNQAAGHYGKENHTVQGVKINKK